MSRRRRDHQTKAIQCIIVEGNSIATSTATMATAIPIVVEVPLIFYPVESKNFLTSLGSMYALRAVDFIIIATAIQTNLRTKKIRIGYGKDDVAPADIGAGVDDGNNAGGDAAGSFEANHQHKQLFSRKPFKTEYLK